MGVKCPRSESFTKFTALVMRGRAGVCGGGAYPPVTFDLNGECKQFCPPAAEHGLCLAEERLLWLGREAAFLPPGSLHAPPPPLRGQGTQQGRGVARKGGGRDAGCTSPAMLITDG